MPYFTEDTPALPGVSSGPCIGLNKPKRWLKRDDHDEGQNDLVWGVAVRCYGRVELEEEPGCLEVFDQCAVNDAIKNRAELIRAIESWTLKCDAQGCSLNDELYLDSALHIQGEQVCSCCNYSSPPTQDQCHEGLATVPDGIEIYGRHKSLSGVDESSGSQHQKRRRSPKPNETPQDGHMSATRTKLNSLQPSGRDKSGNASDGDDLSDRPPNAPRRRSRKNGPRQVRFRCVFWGSTRNGVTADCSTEKKYVSQLRRHHERHDFFYCTNCFATFLSAEAREGHAESGLCVFRCVTEGCHNYDTAPAFNQGPSCNHRRENPQAAQWKHLFLIARPNDDPDAPASQQSRSQQPAQGLVAFAPGVSQAGRRSPLPPLAPATMSQPFDITTCAVTRSDSARRLAETAFELYLLAEKLQPVEDVIDTSSRQTIQWLQQHAELSRQQLYSIASRTLPQSVLDMTCSAYQEARAEENAMSLGPVIPAPQRVHIPEAEGHALSVSLNAQRHDSIDSAPSVDPGLAALGVRRPSSPDSGDLGFDGTNDYSNLQP